MHKVLVFISLILLLSVSLLISVLRDTIRLFLGKTPAWRFGLMRWPAYAGVVRRRRRSFVTKWRNHISRERFDIESTNFARASTPVGLQLCRIRHHWLLLVGSYRSSNKRSKIPPPENGLGEDLEILQRIVDNRPHKCAGCDVTNHHDVYGELQNAIITAQKCVKRVRVLCASSAA